MRKNKVSISKAGKNPKTEYKKFKETLPSNLKDTKRKDYATKRSWKDSGKPSNFEDAKEKMFYPVYHPEVDKVIYHGVSTSEKTGKMYKPKKHKSTYKELEAYRDNEDLSQFRKDTKLVSRGRYLKYKNKTDREKTNPNVLSRVDARTSKKIEKGISKSKKSEAKDVSKNNKNLKNR